ncbi:hypothetical protein FPV58_28755 [Mycolicibacterium porcinum]|uniref:hypothetical protein n=1 Tax=Mycolicibacterium porcinum TaxID=39693 RepID=UPI001197AAB3|nr:hypothetical protein [Mycolicibacterium porcinum]TVX95166.1 hypothetical protein FPV58_28755 [Mycolicibacterium porcinum]
MHSTAPDDYDAVEQSTAWIADATRNLAGLQTSADVGADHAVDPRWGEGSSALDRLRTTIAHHIAALPRQGRPIHSARTGISITHLALAKVLTWQLAEPAAAAAAAVADVEVHVDGYAVSKVYIHLVAVGADPRDNSYLHDGEKLRGRAAAVIAEIIGDSPHITVTWEDIALPPEA